MNWNIVTEKNPIRHCVLSHETVIQILRKRNLLSDHPIRVTPMAGGVSSDIYLLEDGHRKWVVKQALPKLKVQDEWQADISRNQVEQRFIRYARVHVPQNVLPLVLDEGEHCFFVMEYLGEDFITWKQQLLAGTFDRTVALAVARLLATLHKVSWDDAVARQQFQTEDNFYALRVHPYLITAGIRNPVLRSHFEMEAKRLLSTRIALVHGDYSPKNLMIRGTRLILLDHEVAWFGDPAFDLAFLLNHLFLKSLILVDGMRCLELTQNIWREYFETLGNNREESVGPRTIRLLFMLMLARIDGKSPVEYLEGKEKLRQFVRTFVSDLLPAGVDHFNSVYEQWLAQLSAEWK
jgi:aminoglycoside phosphotransferase (APT) family kinase protein